jgi:hypothetical protein
MLPGPRDSLVCVFALAATAVCCASSAVDGVAQTEQTTSNRLTPARPQVRLRLPARPTASSEIVLRVAEITNPALAPLSLDVAFAPCSDSARTWEPEHVASLGVYPPDQAGSYAVPVTAPLGRLRSRGVGDLKDVCLQVRLRLLHEQPADALEIRLSAPEWRDEK